jgi:hypothetical protein
MNKLNLPLEKIEIGLAYYTESTQEYLDFKEAREKHDFEINGIILFNKSVGNNKILQIKADYSALEEWPAVYNVFLHTNGKVLGNIKYTTDKGIEESKISGMHQLTGAKLLLLISEVKENIIECTYIVELPIKSSTIKLFKNDIFKYINNNEPSYPTKNLAKIALTAFDILNTDTDYVHAKNLIKTYFNKEETNKKDQIFMRLTLIDGFYSTQLNKRLFGIEDLVDSIYKIAKTDKELIELALNFIEKPQRNALFKLICEKEYGINKKGESFGKASSLITKYLYFLTNYKFPIYDGLVKVIYPKISTKHFSKNLPSIGQDCSLDFFIGIKKLNEESGINSFDKLDNLLWLSGKIQNNSYQLILSKFNYIIYTKAISRIKFINNVELLKKCRKSSAILEIFPDGMDTLFDFVIQLNTKDKLTNL